MPAFSDLSIPYSAPERSPDPTADDELVSWCLRHKMITPESDMLAAMAKYASDEWTRLAMPLLDTREKYMTMNRWWVWGLMTEFQSNLTRQASDSTASLIHLTEPLIRLLRGDSRPPEQYEHAPLWESLHELLEEADANFGEPWKLIIAESLAKSLECFIWESASGEKEAEVDIVSYAGYRGYTYGPRYVTFLACAMLGVDAHARFLKHPMTTHALDTATNHQAYANDLIGLAKEEFNSETSGNGVLVLKESLGLSREQAISRLVEICNDNMRAVLSIERLMTGIAPRVFPPQERQQIHTFFAILRSGMWGNLEWLRRVGRYSEFDPDEYEMDRNAGKGDSSRCFS
ncbi:hypothetical protein ACFYZT_32060 [Streptomyces sp. NPDC001591]|uniref:terpene synthase family protein n=1 Tax=Streptomyces sp. NPDC001591 TaxID=3364589 RepID=UPI0036B81231